MSMNALLIMPAATTLNVQMLQVRSTADSARLREPAAMTRPRIYVRLGRLTRLCKDVARLMRHVPRVVGFVLA